MGGWHCDFPWLCLLLHLLPWNLGDHAVTAPEFFFLGYLFYQEYRTAGTVSSNTRGRRNDLHSKEKNGVMRRYFVLIVIKINPFTRNNVLGTVDKRLVKNIYVYLPLAPEI